MMLRMDRSEIRLRNARWLAEQIGGIAEFARKMKMSDSQASQIIGENPTRGIGGKIGPRIESEFRLSAGWLDQVHPEEIEHAERLKNHLRHQMVDFDGIPDEEFIQAFSTIKNIESGPDIRGRVPLISWVQAGTWQSIVDTFSPGDADDWMPCPSKYGPHTFALRVRGVSMEPKYQDGDIIFVDPDAEAAHGKNIVVRLDDESEATFKQLVIEGEDKFLKPLNPDWPGPKLIQINGNATICGVVIGKWVPE